MGDENGDDESSVLSVPKEETPIGSIVCLKSEDMKRLEETEDCFILEFDPSESLPLSKLSLDNKNSHDDDAADFSLVAEKAKREREELRQEIMGDENGGDKSSVLSVPKEETRIRNIVCLKSEDMKRFEETEDCFILEFDPSESLPLSKLSLDNKNNHDDDAADFSLVAEKAKRGREELRQEKMGDENGGDKSSVLSVPKQETPSRSVVCLKSEDMKRFEETEDCFILEFDPSESLSLSKLSLDNNNSHDDDDDADFSLVAEKGLVACRDYPHSRHLCLKFSFSTTPHESYCEKCYCYVCDSNAPCKYWTQPLVPHCDANDAYYWKDKRNMMKLVKEADE